MRKTSLSKLKDKADRLLQRYHVPLNPRCLVCGGPTNCMHHYVQKSQCTLLRYDERNLIPLCIKCHSRHHLSGDPRIVETIIEKKGMEWVKELQSVRQQEYKLNRETIAQIITNLEDKP
jgi:hypothetical protein